MSDDGMNHAHRFDVGGKDVRDEAIQRRVVHEAEQLEMTRHAAVSVV